jgi:hypothetical protein
MIKEMEMKKKEKKSYFICGIYWDEFFVQESRHGSSVRLAGLLHHLSQKINQNSRDQA